MRWEAAYELLLGANKKFAELRDADMEDSRTCAETPNSKKVESCTNLSQNTVDQTASDFSKLKEAYETLSFKKDKEVSALLLEKVSLRSQLIIMQQDYAEVLKNKEVVAAQATEAALMLQQSVDEFKVLAQKKDDEIGRLQADALEAKKKYDKDVCALVSEKDSVHNQLTTMQQLLKNKKVLTHKKDHEIVLLRAEAVGAKNKVQKMHFLVKETDDEIQRLKGVHPESVQKHKKDIRETHKKSWYSDPAVIARDRPENSGIRQTVEDYISETRTMDNDGQAERSHKRRRASSMSNDDEMGGSDEDDDVQIGGDKDGDKQSGSAEDGDEQSKSGADDDEQIGSDEDGDKQSGSDEVGDEQSGCDEDGGEQTGSGEDGDGDDKDNQSGRDEETAHNQVQKPPRNTKRQRDAYNNEDKGSAEMSDKVKFVFYIGKGNVRKNERGIDLSEFQYFELDLTSPKRWTIEQMTDWLAGGFGINTEAYTVSVHALWTKSLENIYFFLKRVDRTSRLVNWLEGCENRGTRPIALLLPEVKASTSSVSNSVAHGG